MIAAYVTVIALYHSTDSVTSEKSPTVGRAADWTTVIASSSFRRSRGVLVANLAVSPGTELLSPGPQGRPHRHGHMHGNARKRTWSGGSLPASFRPMTISGIPRIGRSTTTVRGRSVQLTAERARPERVSGIRRPAPGLGVDISRVGDMIMPAPYRVKLHHDRRAAWHSRRRRVVDRAGRGGPVRCGSNHVAGGNSSRR